MTCATASAPSSPVTCTEAGEETRTCSRCKTVETREIAALGHTVVIDTAVAATCTETGLTEGSHCSTCNAVLVEQQIIPALDHDYQPVVTEPTCTEQGYTTYTCSRCGDSYVDTFTAALGHSWSDWVVTTEPTCTTAGEETRTCARCKTEETQPVAALGHDYQAVVTEPTCTEQGYTTHTCSRCSNSYTDTFTPALGHNYQAVVTEPTCTEQGYTTHTCSRCSDSYVDTFTAALGHNWSDWVVTTDPTCTTAGEETRTCARCKTEETRPVDALGHDYVLNDWRWTGVTAATAIFICANDPSHAETPAADITSIRTEPTCEEDGGIVYTATVVFGGKTYTDTKTETLTAIHHSYSLTGWTWNGYASATADFTCANDASHVQHIPAEISSVRTEPTETEDGSVVYTASATFEGNVYTDIKTEVLPATSSEYEFTRWDWADGYTAASAVFTSISDPTLTITKDAQITAERTEPSCEEDGEAVYKAAAEFGGVTYNDEQTVVLKATGHNYALEGWSWTGYTSAYASFVCANDPTHIETLSAEITTVRNEPTCTADGSAVHTATLVFEGKTYTDTSTENLEAPGHDFGEWTVTTPATCTEAGEETRSCSRCSTQETRPVDALGHDYQAVVTDPTCTEKGYTTYTCSRCSDSYKDNYTDALGHDYQAVVTDPTCTERGYTTYTCSRCSDSYTDNFTDALGHDLAKTDAVDAGCTTAGNSEYWTCSRCNTYFSDAAGTMEIAKDSWILPALGHDLTKTDAADADCTTAGNSEYWTCSRCGKYFSDAAGTAEIAKDSWIVPALGHDLTKTEAVAAACEAAGNSEYWTCSRCGKFFSDAAGTTEIAKDSWILPALVHAWAEPTWTWTDFTAATAVFVCENDGAHIETVDAAITRTEAVDKYTYTATVTHDGKTFTDEKTETRKYTITWKNEDGSVIDTTSAAYGSIPSHTTPVKTGSTAYTYIFAGWSPALQTVTGDAEYTATFTEVLTAAVADALLVDTNIAHGKVIPDKTQVSVGTKITLEVIPDEGYTAESVTIRTPSGREIPVTPDENGVWSFELPELGSVIQAVFVESGACDRGTSCPITPFADLDPNAWYHDGVHFALAEGIMNGVGEGLFAPFDSASRAAVVTVLWRMEGKPEAAFELTFTDVLNGMWYTEAIRWAAYAGIVYGYSPETFGTNDPVTREQLAAILYRYSAYKGIDTAVSGDALARFTDAGTIADWAKDAFAWMVDAGIINGMTETELVPGATANRVQLATILMRFLKQYEAVLPLPKAS